MAKGGPPGSLYNDKLVSDKPIMNPPKILDVEERKVWRTVLGHSPHLNHDCYRDLLVMYCQASVAYDKYTAMLEIQGPMTGFKGGDPDIVYHDRGGARNPLIDVREKERKAMIELSIKLSLTHQTRKRHVTKGEAGGTTEGDKRKKQNQPAMTGAPMLKIA